jgi:pectate lyase
MRHRKHVHHKSPLVLFAVGLAATSVTMAVTPQMTHDTASVAASLPAFPGAEGYGTNTPGGRGGEVCKVTNLDDSGAGSLRACVEASGPRTVIFRTGGTIDLESRLEVHNPFLTIAGQTAPGDGITLRMAPGSSTDKGTMQIETHDVVIRYLRFRPGDNGHGDDSHDALQIYKAGVYNIVADHTSFSWAIDENVNTYDESHDITVSNSIISEALSNSTHPQGEHSKGLLSGGVNAHNVSIHHNLFASNVDRNPQVSGVSVADIRNNVVYNYGDGSGAGVTLISSSKGEPDVNWVGNYYKPGPDSDPSRAEFATYNGTTGATHEWYGDANVRWTPSGDQPARVAAKSVGRRSTPFAAPPVTTTSAAQAYTHVLADAGASRVRDAVDERIVTEVRNGTGSFKDSASGLYPTLHPGTPPTDSDGDGMPDSFETSHGTNPSSPDANGDVDGDGYTNIEDWFNGLATSTAGAPSGGTGGAGGAGGTVGTPTNASPTVTAGPDRAVTLPESASVDGAVSDDGLPAGSSVTQSWTLVSGPGSVTFGSPDAPDTTATFSEPGSYVLRLTATDGALSASDDVTVSVADAVAPGTTSLDGITFVGSATAYASRGTVTVPLPSGLVEGDTVLLHVVENKGKEAAIVSPAAAVPLGPEVDDGSSIGSRIYRYDVPADPPSGLTFSGSFSQMSGTATAYRGVSTAVQVAHVVEPSGDAAHPVTGNPTDASWNVVLAADRMYVSGAHPSTWTLDAETVERMDAGGSNSGKSALSQVVGDTGGAVSPGEKSFAATASQASKYAASAIVSLGTAG